MPVGGWQQTELGISRAGRHAAQGRKVQAQEENRVEGVEERKRGWVDVSLEASCSL